MEDSTELLLDTICNTFGGILFISLLVVLLINTSGPSSITDSVDDQDTIDLLELDNLRDELLRENLQAIHKELNDALQQQGEYLQSIDRPTDLAEIERLQRLEVETVSLHAKMSENERKVTALELEKAGLLKSHSEIKNSLLSTNQDLDKVSKAIESEVQKQGRDFIIRLAREQLSFGSDSCVLLDGKLFGPFERWSDEIVWEKPPFEPEQARVNKKLGLLISGKDPNLHELQRRFANTKKVRIFLANNSFSDWKSVERVLQSNDIRFEIIFLNTDSPVFTKTGPTSGLFQ
ncbi:MAG: hypothetical protein Q8M16_07500 [Pirellulaceae bacterium]|nr:hypothetical protein [Pirellulaceae bacterium]